MALPNSLLHFVANRVHNAHVAQEINIGLQLGVLAGIVELLVNIARIDVLHVAAVSGHSDGQNAQTLGGTITDFGQNILLFLVILEGSGVTVVSEVAIALFHDAFGGALEKHPVLAVLACDDCRHGLALAGEVQSGHTFVFLLEFVGVRIGVLFQVVVLGAVEFGELFSEDFKGSLSRLALILKGPLIINNTRTVVHRAHKRNLF